MNINTILKLTLLACLSPVPGIGQEFALPAGSTPGVDPSTVPAVPAPGTAQAAPPPVAITSADNGRTIPLCVGQELRVDFSNPQDGGYVDTAVEFGASSLALLSKAYTDNGAAGDSFFTYRIAGVAPGSGSVVILARRPWSDAAVEVIRIKVEVAASRTAAHPASLGVPDSGATIRLRPGQDLRISLGGQYNDETLNPSYDARVLKYLGVSFAGDTPMDWADDYQVRVFRFSASVRGRTTVLLQVRRPWLPQPETVYKANVIVE